MSPGEPASPRADGSSAPADTDERVRLLILGLGNPLFGDDGVGIEVIARLRARYEWPDDVAVVDGGTLGLRLIPLLEEADGAILVDAIAADAPAASLVRLEGDEVPRVLPTRLSPHEMGVVDLLFGAEVLGQRPEPLVLLGLVPERLDWGLERSPAVEARIDTLLEAVLEEAGRLGVTFQPTSHDAPSQSERWAPGGLARPPRGRL